MTTQLEVMAAQSQTDVWEDPTAIFYEDGNFVPPKLSDYTGRKPAWHFNPDYEAS